jgi:DNA-binding NtrC family response regulator
VEDEEENTRQLMRSLLIAAGYECRVAENLREMLYIYGVVPRLDLVCCSMDSLESVTKAKRAASLTPAVPLIVSIPTLDSGLTMKVLDMGAYDVLFRRFMREQLVYSVRRALQCRRLKLENLYFRYKLHLGSGIELPLSLLVGRWDNRNTIGPSGGLR